VRWVSFGTAVPFWSSDLAVARHLPHGRSPGGDRHLNFYGNRDNLKTDLTKQLTEGIAALTTTRQWERWLRAQRAFHRYSFGNTLLILRQFPEATRVAGFHGWRQLGRFVRKGEQGIAILAPVKMRPELQDNGDDELSPVAYRIAYVFDISKTGGEPLLEIACRLSGDDPAGASVRLEKVAAELGYSVAFTQLPGERNGDCAHELRRIRVSDRLAPAHRAKTLAHELAPPSSTATARTGSWRSSRRRAWLTSSARNSPWIPARTASAAWPAGPETTRPSGRSRHRASASPRRRGRSWTAWTTGRGHREPLPACLHRAGQCASVLAGIKVVRPVGRSTLTPAAARQARRVAKAGRFYASQLLDNQALDNPIALGLGGKEIKCMHETASPCGLDDKKTVFKAWETWSVNEDGSPRDLQRTDDPSNGPQYWLCSKCSDEFYSWPEVEKHFLDAITLMAATV
jgi:hypothetical protein